MHRSSKKRKQSEFNNNITSKLFSDIHQAILNSSTFSDAAKLVDLSLNVLNDSLKEIDISYIELKILNETQLYSIMGENYFKLFNSMQRYDLYPWVIHTVLNKINDRSFAKNFLSSTILTHYLDTYFHQFLYGNVPLKLIMLLDLNFDLNLIKYNTNEEEQPSLADIHTFIFERPKSSPHDVASYFKMQHRALQLLIATKEYNEISLEFDDLKKITKQTALTTWGHDYYQPLRRINFLDSHLVFKKLHLSIHTSTSITNASIKLGTSHAEVLTGYLQNINIFYFELLILDVNEIKFLIGDKYNQKIDINFPFDLSTIALTKILAINSSPLLNDYFNKIGRSQFLTLQENYLKNFIYDDQPLTIARMKEPHFSISAVRKKKQLTFLSPLPTTSSFSSTTPAVTTPTTEMSAGNLCEDLLSFGQLFDNSVSDHLPQELPLNIHEVVHQHPLSTDLTLVDPLSFDNTLTEHNNPLSSDFIQQKRIKLTEIEVNHGHEKSSEFDQSKETTPSSLTNSSVMISDVSIQELSAPLSKSQTFPIKKDFSLAYIHNLILSNPSITITQVAFELNIYRQTLKTKLGKFRYKNLPLNFEQLKSISLEEAEIAWGDHYHQSLLLPIKNAKNLSTFTFEEIHSTIQSSTSSSDAAAKFGVNCRVFLNYFKKANLFYFELLFLEKHEIIHIIGDKYHQKITKDFQYNLSVATLNKILITANSGRKFNDYIQDIDKNFMISIEKYLNNFLYNDQLLSLSLLTSSSFDISDVRNKETGEPLSFNIQPAGFLNQTPSSIPFISEKILIPDSSIETNAPIDQLFENIPYFSDNEIINNSSISEPLLETVNSSNENLSLNLNSEVIPNVNISTDPTHDVNTILTNQTSQINNDVSLADLHDLILSTQDITIPHVANEEEQALSKIKSGVNDFIPTLNEEKRMEIYNHIVDYLRMVKSTEMNREVAEHDSVSIPCTNEQPTNDNLVLASFTPQSDPSIDYGAINTFGFFNINRMPSQNNSHDLSLNESDQPVFQPQF